MGRYITFIIAIAVSAFILFILFVGLLDDSVGAFALAATACILFAVIIVLQIRIIELLKKKR